VTLAVGPVRLVPRISAGQRCGSPLSVSWSGGSGKCYASCTFCSMCSLFSWHFSLRFLWAQRVLAWEFPKLFPSKQRSKTLILFLFLGGLFTRTPHSTALPSSSFCTLPLNPSGTLTGFFIRLKMDLLFSVPLQVNLHAFLLNLPACGFFCFTCWSLILFSLHRNKCTLQQLYSSSF